MKKKIWKVIKYFLIIIAGLLVLIFAAIYSLQFPAVQNFVKDKALAFLQKKIQTKVSLDRVYVHFPNKIEVEKFYLQGQDVDTLLYVNSLNVGLNLPKLLNNTAEITSVDLNGLTANVVKKNDSTFNFNYIIDAFATDDKEDDSSQPFLIDLDKIRLRNLNVNYEDVNGKNDISLRLTDFQTVVETFDLDKNNYAVDFVDASGMKLIFNQGFLKEDSKNSKEKTDTLSYENPLKVGVNKLNLEDFDVLYNDENAAMRAKIVFKTLNSKIDKLDLPNTNFEISSLLFNDAFVDLLLKPQSEETKSDEQPEIDQNSIMNVLLHKAVFRNVNLKYNNGIGTNTTNGFNADHLDLLNLNGTLNHFQMKNTSISGAVKNISFRENSGFVLNDLSTKFKYTDTETELNDLYLKTPNTELQRSLKLSYASIDDLSNNLGNIGISANLPETKIGFKDLLWLAPDLKNTVPFNKYPNAVLNLSANVSGKVNDLLVQEFKLSGLGNLNVNAAGTIKNALDTDHLWMNLKVNDFTAGKQFVQNLVLPNTLPDAVELPNVFGATGRLKGGLDDIFVDLGIRSDFGKAKIIGTFNQKVKNAERYDLQAGLQDFNVGKLLKQQVLGTLTAHAKISGTGLDFTQNTAKAEINVKNAIYNKYTYQNIALNAALSSGNYEVNLNSDDENVAIDLVASGIYDSIQPTVKMNGTLSKIDVNKLGFTQTPLALTGKINVDFSSLNPDALNGTLTLENFSMFNGKNIFPIQTITLDAVSNKELNSLDLQSQILELSVTGKYNLTQISNSLLYTLNQYYHFQDENPELKIEPHQYFNFKARFKNDVLIQEFVPDLTSFENVNLYGVYNADAQKITMYGSVPQIKYGAYTLNNIRVSAGNDAEQLNYSLTLKDLDSEQFRLANIGLNGLVANNQIDYELSVKNDENVEQYKIAGNVATENDLIQLSLKNDGLILNYKPWTVANDNQLTLFPQGLVAHNLEMNSDKSSILVTSETETPESPLNIRFKDFEIETLTEIIRKGSLLAEGTINGEAQLKNLQSDLLLTADLDIANLKVFGNLIGNIDAKVANETANLYNAKVHLSGAENNLDFAGSYNTAQSSFDAIMNVKALQMQSIQGFSMDQLRDAKGFISGSMKLSGTTDVPSILGSLKFNDVGFGITQLNTTLQNINDEIAFTSRGIEFKNFKLNDADNNSLSINGAVLTKTYQDFDFDLRLNARNFKVVNSTQTENQMLYGVMAVNANIGIKGNLDLPKIDGQVTVTDKTDFTFVLPQSSPALQEREGIIEFVDQDQLSFANDLNQEDEQSTKTLTGLDANLNIEVDKEAQLSIIIDKTNGDFIKLKGEAELTGGVDPSGKTTLVGRYEVNEGAYEMSVNVLKRKFEIQKGSAITWTGEPMKADVDITAIYNTKAVPMDLLEQQLTETEGTSINMFKQRIPFNTLLKMSGELLEPIITFDIQVEENNPSVSSEVISMTKSKLDQLRTEESEMNKQVFALLLLNRFIGENPFQSSTGLSAESMARQSVSKLLSQQLNNLAADLIEGVELNFDLESTDDYSTGTKDTRTDLNVGISKTLLNDRLKVTVGSNFGLEGNERQNEQMTNIAGDIQIEYMLSRDGRYIVRAYRKNEYQLALQGQIIETGVGFIITVDYNKFKELLRRRKVNRAYKRTQRSQRTIQHEQTTETQK